MISALSFVSLFMTTVMETAILIVVSTMIHAWTLNICSFFCVEVLQWGNFCYTFYHDCGYCFLHENAPL